MKNSAEIFRIAGSTGPYAEIKNTESENSSDKKNQIAINTLRGQFTKFTDLKIRLHVTNQESEELIFSRSKKKDRK